MGKPLRPIDPHSALCAAATSCGAQAVGDWLLESGKLNMPVHRLTFSDLEGVAYAAIGGYIRARADQLARGEIGFDEL